MKEAQEKEKACEAVRCPHCGWEYHPAEIFCPDWLIGKPEGVKGKGNGIVRDGLGKIIYVEYGEDGAPSLREEFFCEHCGKPFIAEAEVSFRSRPQDEELDFTEEEASLF